jgi:lysine biosynthesis protein LysW
VNAVITECPSCDAAVEIELTEVSPGDCVVCSECDEALTVVTVKPLELAVDEDYEEHEDDFEDDEELDDDPDDSEDDDDLGDDDDEED